jgi:hypothetical protein
VTVIPSVQRAVTLAVVAAAVSAPAAPAHAAEWFQLGARALPPGDSAAPDAPVLGVGYGPRAQSRLGLDVAVATARRETRTLRLGFSALVAFDNSVSRSPLAGELGSTAIELSLAWALDAWALRRLGPRGVLELALVLGRRTAFSTERTVLLDPYRTDDVPFGAGGTSLGGSAQGRLGLAAAWDLTVRAGLRVYLNTFADLAGSREVSDAIADLFHEGAAWQTSLEAAIARRLGETARLRAAVYLETIGPHDDTGKQLWLARLELGPAFAAHAFAILPFVDLDAGHGPSLLVNRTELRATVGVKLYAH